MPIKLITTFDIIYSIIIFLLIISYANSIKAKNIEEKPCYRYYTRGLIVKILGAVCFCLIYALYYKGGDTVNYFLGIDAMMDVFLDEPVKYFELLFHQKDAFSKEAFSSVDNFPPYYMYRDSRTFTVIKISSLFSLPGFGGFLSTTVLISTFIYSWVWKLYLFLAKRYKNDIKSINFAILFLPSTVFWGSGIMKDTFTFGAACYSVYGLHQFFIQRKRLLKTIIQLIFAFYIIITVKAYIMFALLPGLLIFANFERLKKIKSTFVKVIVLPFSIIIVFIVLDTLLFDFNDLFGKYSADRILEEAVIQNADLQRGVYGTNSFDIGEFSPTIQGVLGKFFPAISAALFRPFIWESGGSPTMIFSGLETTFIFILFILVLLKGPILMIRTIISDPFLVFCVLFTLILGFGVGLSTSNFGALVRYKIPYLPFFVFLLFRIRNSKS